MNPRHVLVSPHGCARREWRRSPIRHGIRIAALACVPLCVAGAARRTTSPGGKVLLPIRLPEPSRGVTDTAPTEGQIAALVRLAAERTGQLVTLPRFDSAQQFLKMNAVRGSSHSTWRDKVYRPENAFDGNYRTAWVEGLAGHGTGEWIALDFEVRAGAPVPVVTGLLVVPGFAKNEFMFGRNSRPRILGFAVACASNGLSSRTVVSRDLRVADVRQPQLFLLDPTSRRVLTGRCVLTITLKRVYPGTHYADTSIAEARLVLGMGVRE